MPDYVIMPKSHYQDTCTEVRRITGETHDLTSNEIVSLLSHIEANTDNPQGGTSMLEYISGDQYHLVVPNGTTNIKHYAFYRDPAMESVRMPETLKTVGAEAFRDCTSLTSVEVPSSVEEVSYRAFSYCTKLSVVSFKGMPHTIRNDVFQMSNVSDIYVPWDENEIPNAPWGAVNATIHYKTEV